MAKKKYPGVPTVSELYIPVVKALIELEGSGNIEEINEKVYDILKLPDDIIAVMHDSSRTKIEYRLAWARSILKMQNILENSARSVWALKNPNINIKEINAEQIERTRRAIDKKENVIIDSPKIKDDIEIENEIDWKSTLINKLYLISASAFERLSQRLLRESGFVQVEVTGKSGDGGIDGKGIVKISGFLSFHVIFQCKRYKGSITPSQIRDFRGAMQGRADKGLFITTGSFTRDADKEAKRDGAPPIDLIDGEMLCEKLKELKLGIEVEFIENVKVDTAWFDQF